MGGEAHWLPTLQHGERGLFSVGENLPRMRKNGDILEIKQAVAGLSKISAQNPVAVVLLPTPRTVTEPFPAR